MVSRLASALDSAIGFFSPSAGAARLADRLRLGQLREIERLGMYAEATPTALDPAISGRGVSPDLALELGRDRRHLVDRITTAERDNALVGAILSKCVEAVVGTGYRYQARVGGMEPSKEDEKWNREAERLITEWSTPDNCDSRGTLRWDQQLSLTFRGKMRDGEAGLIKQKGGPRSPLGGKLRAFESSELGTPEGYYKPSAVDGIELDADMAPKNFHIYKPDPNMLWADRRISGARDIIPARSVIFTARRQRIGQTRGVSAFNGGMDSVEQLRGVVQSVVVGYRMATCLGLVIAKTTNNGMGVVPNPQTSSGLERQLPLRPGQSIFLQPGETVTQVTPTLVNAEFLALVKFLARWASLHFGVTVEQVLCDFSDNNFSNTKANILHSWCSLGILQHDLKLEVATPVLLWKLREFMELGLLKKRPDYALHHWRTPGQLWIDPVDDINAAMARIDANLDTLEGVASRHGDNFAEIVAQRALERKMLKAADLEECHSTLTRDSGETIANARDPRSQGGAAGKKPEPGKEKASSLRGVRERVARGLRKHERITGAL